MSNDIRYTENTYVAKNTYTHAIVLERKSLRIVLVLALSAATRDVSDSHLSGCSKDVSKRNILMNIVEKHRDRDFSLETMFIKKEIKYRRKNKLLK